MNRRESLKPAPPTPVPGTPVNPCVNFNLPASTKIRVGSLRTGEFYITDTDGTGGLYMVTDQPGLNTQRITVILPAKGSGSRVGHVFDLTGDGLVFRADVKIEVTPC